jgi:hypothetical protein
MKYHIQVLQEQFNLINLNKNISLDNNLEFMNFIDTK